MDGDSRDTERTISRMPLRLGGWIGYDDDAVFVQRDDEQGFRIDRESIARITLNPLEWDLTVMGLLLLGIGGYVGATRNPLVGVGFFLVGCWSLYRTYSKRYEVVIFVDDNPKPVSVYPEAPKECHRTLGELIGGGESGGSADLSESSKSNESNDADDTRASTQPDSPSANDVSSSVPVSGDTDRNT